MLVFNILEARQVYKFFILKKEKKHSLLIQNWSLNTLDILGKGRNDEILIGSSHYSVKIKSTGFIKSYSCPEYLHLSINIVIFEIIESNKKQFSRYFEIMFTHNLNHVRFIFFLKWDMLL